jgi:glycosyltransferase involved in cell wall biosynthesis
MKKNFTVSVVMATYNGERNIIEQLDSLKNQTCLIDELLIYDDGSTDQTVEIIQKYIDEHHLENWKVTVNPVNKGWRQNFIDLLVQAQGTYVFPCDQDDVWHIDKIEKMSTKMANNADIAVLVSNYEEKIEEGGHSSKLRTLKTKQVGTDEKVVFVRDNVILKRPGCVYAVRKDFIPKAVEYFNQALNSAHDLALWASALAVDRLYLLNEATITFRKHGNSTFKKEMVKSEKASKYQYRINMLNRYNERLNSLKEFVLLDKDVANKEQKEKIIHQMMQENTDRVQLLERKKIGKIIFSFNVYTKPFDYFADIYHTMKLSLGKE